MLKSRILLAIGLSLIMMLIAIPFAMAQPQQQATPTPEPPLAMTNTPEATAAPTNTLEPTATSVAPAVSPLATPGPGAVSTPSTLPATGASDDGSAALGTLAIIVGAVLIVGGFGVALSRRSHTPR